MTSEQLAWKIRRHGIEMTHLSGGSHIGAIMSVADVIGVLYAEESIKVVTSQELHEVLILYTRIG